MEARLAPETEAPRTLARLNEGGYIARSSRRAPFVYRLGLRFSIWQEGFDSPRAYHFERVSDRVRGKIPQTKRRCRGVAQRRHRDAPGPELGLPQPFNTPARRARGRRADNGLTSGRAAGHSTWTRLLGRRRPARGGRMIKTIPAVAAAAAWLAAGSALAAGFTVPAAVQQRMGLAVAQLETQKHSTEVDAFAKVLDPEPLVQLDSDLRTAEAAAEASACRGRTRRARCNAAGGGVAAQGHGGRRSPRRRQDALKVELLRRRLGLEWGPGRRPDERRAPRRAGPRPWPPARRPWSTSTPTTTTARPARARQGRCRRRLAARRGAGPGARRRAAAAVVGPDRRGDRAAGDPAVGRPDPERPHQPRRTPRPA